MEKYRTWKLTRWQKRMAMDWQKLNDYLVKIQAPAWYRKQLRRDVIKGISHFFEEKGDK